MLKRSSIKARMSLDQTRSLDRITGRRMFHKLSMSKLDLSVGDIVSETYLGYRSHKEYHGKKNLSSRVAGVPVDAFIPVPKFLWRARKGEVIEVQARWWNQEGHDVKVQWKDGGEPEWHLADSQHLVLIRKARRKESGSSSS